MKVMLAIPHIAGGGGERVASALACSLRAEIVVVVFEERFSYPVDGRLISLNTPINRKSAVTRACGFLQRVVRFRRVLREEHPDVVLSFMGEANLINALLSRRPILAVHVHLSAIGEMRSRAERFAVRVLTRWLYRRATVTAVSDSVKQDLVETFGIPARQIVVIPNAVDAPKIDEMAGEPLDRPWKSELPVLITAGRLTPEKAQDHLLRAFAEVRKARACQLAIIGSGELEGSLKSLAKELRIDDDVFFLGWQTNPFKFMARADVFVLCSRTEAFPLVLLEAMACGLPVIATDSPGGTRELIMGGAEGPCGVLVPGPNRPTAEKELAKELVKMLDDRETRSRYREAGRLRVRDFDPAIFVENYQRLLESVL